MKMVRVMIGSIVVAGLLFFIFFVPLPVSRVRELALVQVRPEAMQKVVVQLPGILYELNVRDGQNVQEGDILGRMRSLDIEMELYEYRAQRDISLAEYQSLERRAITQQNMSQEERSKLDSRIKSAQGQYNINQELANYVENKLKLLVLHAPCDGVVMSPPRVDEIGKLYEKNTVLCTVGDPTKLSVLMPVSPADYRVLDRDLKDGSELPVVMRVHGRAADTWHGKICQLPESAAKKIPVQLTNKSGGNVAVRPTAKSDPDEMIPQSQQFLIEIDILDSDSSICPGTMAQVKVKCKWRTTAWWVWRAFNSAFDLGMDWTDFIPGKTQSSPQRIL